MGEVKLYRNINELLHPAISKKNISNYTIIIDEDILPVQVYYPKKVSHIEKVIIFIHGSSTITECNYMDIYKLFAKNTDSLVIAVEYDDVNYKKMYKDIFKTVSFIHKGLVRNNIDSNNITLIGDSTGCNIITGINYLNKKEIDIKKEVLFYPVISLDYEKAKYDSMIKNKDFNLGILTKLRSYYEKIEYKSDKLLKPLELKDYDGIPKTLIVVGKVDSLRDEAKEYYDKLNSNNEYKELENTISFFICCGIIKMVIIMEAKRTTKKEIVKMLLKNTELDSQDEEELIDLLIDQPISIDVDKQEEAKLTFGDKMADKVSEKAGSWGFVFGFVLFLIFWVILNTVIMLDGQEIDPYPFILLNLVLSCIAALQAPIIMMSQNRQAAKDSLRNQNDYRIDLKSEIILEELHDKMELILKNQRKIIRVLEEDDEEDK